MIRSIVAIFAFALASSAFAAGTEYKIVIKDHLFVPATIEVPAGQKIELIVENQDEIGRASCRERV